MEYTRHGKQMLEFGYFHRRSLSAGSVLSLQCHNQPPQVSST
jgi:hypothetical protein